METATAPPSYASTNGHGMPIVYDREGLSEAQQITLENLCRHRAQNQRQRREWARQGSDDEKEKEESLEEIPLQENRNQDEAGRGRASIRARPRPGTYNSDHEQDRCIPGGYEEVQNPKPYDFITANVEVHYNGHHL